MRQSKHNQIADALTGLRSAVEGGQLDISVAVDETIESVLKDLDLVFSEHEGMANELIRAYEQLGIVFEITSRLSSAEDEDDVVHLFVESLKITYQDIKIYSVEKADSQVIRWAPVPPNEAEQFESAIRSCAEKRRTFVEKFDAPVSGIKEVMAAPVFAGEQFVCAIVFLNDCTDRCFEASDMSLIDALVSVCGDFLQNYQLAGRLRALSIDTVRSLVSAVDQKDEYTSGHSTRVGRFAKMLGAELGLTGHRLQMLEWAALLHDVGKIGIRDDVLKKPGKLTQEEFEHIKEHPVRSYEVVKAIPQMAEALGGVRHHHERYDGKGYPDGLSGEDIPHDARIILVADVFDALTTTRSYRKAFSFEKALTILTEEAGTVGDPKLVPVFVDLIRREVAAGRVHPVVGPQVFDSSAIAIEEVAP